MAAHLNDKISNAPRRPFTGAAFRQQVAHFDPLSGEGARIHGGRFNAPESFPVLYLCSTPGCSAAEFIRATQHHPLGPAGFLPRTLYRYEINLTAVLDLTDETTLAHLGLTFGALVEEDRTLTHQIGEVARQFGYQAVLNASATGVNEVLAVIIDNLRSGIVAPHFEATWSTIDDLPLL